MSVSKNAQTAVVTAAPMTTASAAVVAAAGPQVRYIANTAAAILYLRFGTAAASATDYTVQLAAGAVFEMSTAPYGGAIQGILASGTGNAVVTTY